tara:strand:+ start:435 stop:1088 length:654 start_codon:yes stop_codon:yes gene_type:complete
MSEELIKRIISSIILIPVSLFFIIKGSVLFNLFIILVFLISSYEWYRMSKNKSYLIFGFLFLLVSFYTIYKVRNVDDNFYYFLSILLICISTDIGGYIFGKLFGGPKLTKISPKKTYAGMLGGYLLSLLALSLFYNSSYLFTETIKIGPKILIFILLISTSSQLGDIIISYFKRLSNIKDTGKIIPGHGGLLDRVDGMIFAFPFSYILFKINIINFI